MKLFNHRLLFNQAGDGGQGGGGAGAGGQGGGAAPAFREQVFQPDGSFSQDWHRHLGDEFKDAAPQLSRFKSFADLTKSFLHGQKQLSTRPQMPDDKAAPEQIAAWRTHLGLPTEDAAWDVAKPEKLPDGIEWDDGLAKEFAGWARQSHVNPKALGSFVEKYNALAAERGKSASEKHKAEAMLALQNDEKALREAWGKDFDSHKHLALKAAATSGLPANHYALTDPEVMKAFHKLAIATGEKPAVGGANPTLGGDPGTQARLIQTDQSNPNYAAYHNQNHPNHKAVREMVFNLNKQAVGG
jgi:hypothetical protein